MSRSGGLLAFVALGAGALLTPQLIQPKLALEPIAGLPGYERVARGGGALDPFAGIGAEALPFTSPCIPSDRPVVQVFTDYNCPNCPAFEATLAGLDLSGAEVVWQDYAILGPSSVYMAKVALAAREQGAYEQVHRRLIRGLIRPGPAALRQLAVELGLDAERLIADVADLAREAELRTIRARAETLGIIGTPAALFGKTLIEGTADRATLQVLLDGAELTEEC